MRKEILETNKNGESVYNLAAATQHEYCDIVSIRLKCKRSINPDSNECNQIDIKELKCWESWKDTNINQTYKSGEGKIESKQWRQQGGRVAKHKNRSIT